MAKILVLFVVLSAAFLAACFGIDIQAAGVCCTIVITSNLDTDFVITSNFPDFTNYEPQTFTKKDAVATPSFTHPAGKYLWEIRGAFPRTYTIRVNTIPGYEALYSKNFIIPEGYDYFTSNIAINYNVMDWHATSPTNNASVSPPPSSLDSPCRGTASIDETAQVPPGIVVSSNAMGAKFTISGPATYTGPGVAWYKPDVPLGTYAIIWSPIAGCDTPPPETKTLQAGKWIGFAGNYKDLSAPKGYGAVEINTNLNQSAEFTIKGPAEKVMKGTGASWLSAPIGVYTVHYGAVPGFVAPIPETKTLDIGGTINFYGNYRPENVIKKTQPPQQVQNTLEERKIETQTLEKTIEEIPRAVPSQPLKPQRNFFLRFLEGISFFFRRLF